MTATTAPATRASILSRAMILRFVSIVGSSVGFCLPLAAIPLYADAPAGGPPPGWRPGHC
jgi:hypothetical protein